MSGQIMITLQQIRDARPCEDGWRQLLRYQQESYGMHEPFPLSDVLTSNGLQDCLWCLRCLPEHANLWRLYAIWCARQVQHLMTDARSLAALDIAEQHAMGMATDAQLAAARAAARDAAWDAAWDAAGDAAWAAARAAARAAAGDAARDAAWAAARDAAWDAAGAAAWDAARAAQRIKLRQILDAGQWVE